LQQVARWPAEEHGHGHGWHSRKRGTATVECRARRRNSTGGSLATGAPLQLEEAQALEAHWLPCSIAGGSTSTGARRLPVAPLLGNERALEEQGPRGEQFQPWLSPLEAQVLPASVGSGVRAARAEPPLGRTDNAVTALRHLCKRQHAVCCRPQHVWVLLGA